MSVGLRISIEPKKLEGLTERKRQEIERRISPSIDKTASAAYWADKVKW